MQLDEIRQKVVEMSGGIANDVKFVVSPYRICPLGAHIDHQVSFKISESWNLLWLRFVIVMAKILSFCLSFLMSYIMAEPFVLIPSRNFLKYEWIQIQIQTIIFLSSYFYSCLVQSNTEFCIYLMSLYGMSICFLLAFCQLSPIIRMTHVKRTYLL